MPWRGKRRTRAQNQALYGHQGSGKFRKEIYYGSLGTRPSFGPETGPKFTRKTRKNDAYYPSGLRSRAMFGTKANLLRQAPYMHGRLRSQHISDIAAGGPGNRHGMAADTYIPPYETTRSYSSALTPGFWNPNTNYLANLRLPGGPQLPQRTFVDKFGNEKRFRARSKYNMSTRLYGIYGNVPYRRYPAFIRAGGNYIGHEQIGGGGWHGKDRMRSFSSDIYQGPLEDLNEARQDLATPGWRDRLRVYMHARKSAAKFAAGTGEDLHPLAKYMAKHDDMPPPLMRQTNPEGRAPLGYRAMGGYGPFRIADRGTYKRKRRTSRRGTGYGRIGTRLSGLKATASQPINLVAPKIRNTMSRAVDRRAYGLKASGIRRINAKARHSVSRGQGIAKKIAIASGSNRGWYTRGIHGVRPRRKRGLRYTRKSYGRTRRLGGNRVLYKMPPRNP